MHKLNEEIGDDNESARENDEENKNEKKNQNFFGLDRLLTLYKTFECTYRYGIKANQVH